MCFPGRLTVPAPPLLLLMPLFFSSRRRHTRLQGDWSSDVCSSDLCAWPWGATTGSRAIATRRSTTPTTSSCGWRSEERRVGKEGGQRVAGVDAHQHDDLGIAADDARASDGAERKRAVCAIVTRIRT